MKTPLKALVAVVSATAFFMHPTLWAQGEESGEDSIYTLDPFTIAAGTKKGYAATNTISGTLVRTPLKDIPMKIDVLTSQFLEDQAVYSLADSLNQVSAMDNNRRATSDKRIALFNIRGFGTDFTLKNGVPSNYKYNSMYSVERVEVIKGPSALYGVSAPGGIVNLVSKKPEFYGSFTTVKATTGTHDLFRTDIDTNHVIMDDKLAARFIGTWHSSEAAQPFVHREYWNINPLITFRPWEATKVTIDYNYLQQTDGAAFRSPVPFLRDKDPLGIRRPATLDPNWTNNNEDDTWNIWDETIELNLTHAFTENIFAQVNYTRNDFEHEIVGTWNALFANSDNATAPRWPSFEWEDETEETIYANFLFEFNTGEVRHKLIAGWRSHDREGFNRTWIDFNGSSSSDPNFSTSIPLNDPFADLTGFTVPDKGAIMADVGAPNNQNQTFEGGANTNYFVTDVVEFMKGRLNVILGLRETELDEGDTFHDHQVGFTFDINDAISLYAQNATGSESNGINDNTGVPPNTYWDPELSDAWDLGLKFHAMDGALSGSIAYFDITKENIVNSAVVDPLLGTRSQTLSGEQVSDGYDMDLVFSPTDQLQLMLAASVMDPRVTKETGVTDVDDDGIDEEVDRSGRKLQGVSTKQVSLWSRYEFTEGPLDNLVFGGGFQWREGPFIQHNRHDRTDIAWRSDPFIVNFFAQYSIEGEALTTTFQFNAHNITDSRYMKARGEFNDDRRYDFSVKFDF